MGCIWGTILFFFASLAISKIWQKIKEIDKKLNHMSHKQASAEMAESLLTKALQLTDKGKIDLSVNSAGRDIENG